MSRDLDDTLAFECDLDAPPERVWRALTVPELLAAWLMPNDIRPEVGARFTFRPERSEGDGPIECEVLQVEKDRLIRLSWRDRKREGDEVEEVLDSVVTFAISRTETGGTHLKILHTGFVLSLGRTVVRLAGVGPAVSIMPAVSFLRSAAAANPNAQRSLPWAA